MMVARVAAIPCRPIRQEPKENSVRFRMNSESGGGAARRFSRKMLQKAFPSSLGLQLNLGNNQR